MKKNDERNKKFSKIYLGLNPNLELNQSGRTAHVKEDVGFMEHLWHA